jgi:hypothetical protein
VTINGVQLNNFANAGDGDDTMEPFWSFSVEVPDNQPTVPIQIQLWDQDDCDYAFCTDTPVLQSDDDQADVDPVAGNTNVDIDYDVNTHTWTGDTSTGCSTGDFTATKATVCWDISDLSTSGDADGDGLLDSWEQRGFDANSDGVIDDGTNDVLLRTMGADPLHKDLFLETDVMTGTAPLSQNRLQRIKDAFSNAPLTNPDGVNGVNFHLDLGPSPTRTRPKTAPASATTDSTTAGETARTPRTPTAWRGRTWAAAASSRPSPPAARTQPITPTKRPTSTATDGGSSVTACPAYREPPAPPPAARGRSAETISSTSTARAPARSCTSWATT